MPKRLAVHFECERCPRSWFEDYEEGQDMPESISFHAEFAYPTVLKTTETLKIDFDVLCGSCSTTVHNLFDSINKTDKKSPERGAKKEDSDESPEVNVTPTAG